MSRSENAGKRKVTEVWGVGARGPGSKGQARPNTTPPGMGRNKASQTHFLLYTSPLEQCKAADVSDKLKNKGTHKT